MTRSEALRLAASDSRVLRLALTDDVAADGPALFVHCITGRKGIVSKRRSSPYRSGRLPHWLKSRRTRPRQQNNDSPPQTARRYRPNLLVRTIAMASGMNAARLKSHVKATISSPLNVQANTNQWTR
jgi:hypothetical protein